MKKYRFEILLFVFYTLLAIIITYPLILNFSSSLYTIPERLIDGLADIYDLWWYKQTFLNGGDPNFIPHLGIDGVSLWRSVPYSMLIAHGVTKWLTVLFNEVFAFNTLILMSFPLAGFAMYLLAHYLTKNRWASVLAGFIFAFAPLHQRYAFEWLGMTQWHWLPLYVLALLKLDKLKSVKWGLLTGLLFSIVFIENYYFGYFTIFFTIFFVLFRVFRTYVTEKKFYLDRLRFQSYLLALFASVVLTLPITLTFVTESSHLAAGEATIPGFTHDEWQRFALSARPWFYLLPDTLHPVFGKHVQKINDWIATKPPYFITEPFYPREHTLFLGWTTLILSAIAVFAPPIPQPVGLKPRNPTGFPRRRSAAYVRLFLFLGIVMAIFSAPPYVTVSGLKIYFPSYFLAKIFPMFRSYARFGVLVLLCTSVLAAFGLKFILDKIKSPRRCFLVFMFLCFLSFFEFLNFPRFRNEGIGPTPAHEWVAQQPGNFAVAEYLVFNNLPLIRQRHHKKRLVNPLRWAPGEVEAAMKKVDSPETAVDLLSWDVKYLILHTREPDFFGDIAWFKLVASFPEDIFHVFEVTRPRYGRLGE